MFAIFGLETVFSANILEAPEALYLWFLGCKKKSYSPTKSVGIKHN
jgi:hypothetical protein